MATTTSPLENIDWANLRQQKLWLLAQTSEEADGLVNLLDNLQDYAVDVLEHGEDTIFGVRDRNGNELTVGVSVLTDEPQDDDTFEHAFRGTVTGFRLGNVQVENGDGDTFEIDRERLELDQD
jgi:hypothetical protein